MNESICRFMSAKNEDAAIKTVRFVYETQCFALKQPFVHPVYVLHIVTQGTATLRTEDASYALKRGDIFFAFPASAYYLEDMEDFEYIYISFMGSGAAAFLSRCQITCATPYFPNFGFLCTMFENAIRRITPLNANLLTEGVLYYTLSFFSDHAEAQSEAESPQKADSLFETIVDYVDRHYRENDMSLSRLADTFSYSENYLSAFFKKRMQLGFVTYLNHLRIQYAVILIEKGERNIAKIAAACGYSNYSYFSKVFKKNTGKTPTESMGFLENGHKTTGA